MFKTISRVPGTGLCRKALGAGGERLSRGIYRVSNRLTTSEVRREYTAGLKNSPYTLSKMLANMQPKDFGPANETTFVAMPNAEKVSDQFLARGRGQRTDITVKQFRNGESYARIEKTVRGKKVVILVDRSRDNINDSLVETLLAIDAAKRASAKEVVLVCPELPYVGDQPGTPNYELDYFKLVLNLLFKGAQLDELRLGDIVLNRRRSLLFLQDQILSRRVAPFISAWSEHLAAPKTMRDEVLYFMGNHFRQNAKDVIAAMKGVKGRIAGLALQPGERQRINCVGLPYENLAGKTAVVFQTCNTGRVNDDFLEALLMVYSARQKGAKEILLVMPYMPYNRQERKAKTGEPISAKLVANALMSAAGVTQVISFDLHAPATQGFFDRPMQHITALHLIINFVRRLFDSPPSDNWCISRELFVAGAPDVGRGKTAQKFGEAIAGPETNVAIIYKYRPKPGEAAVRDVTGNVAGKDVFIIDDMIDSGGTIIAAVEAFIQKGARKVFVATVHGIFSDVSLELAKAREEYQRIAAFLTAQGKHVDEYVSWSEDRKVFTVNALIRLQAHPTLSGLIVTNSLLIPEKNIVDPDKVKMIAIDDLIAMVCGRIISNQSLRDYQFEGS